MNSAKDYIQVSKNFSLGLPPPCKVFADAGQSKWEVHAVIHTNFIIKIVLRPFIYNFYIKLIKVRLYRVENACKFG